MFNNIKLIVKNIYFNYNLQKIKLITYINNFLINLTTNILSIKRNNINIRFSDK
jgi:hypothetical protein